MYLSPTLSRLYKLFNCYLEYFDQAGFRLNIYFFNYTLNVIMDNWKLNFYSINVSKRWGF